MGGRVVILPPARDAEVLDLDPAPLLSDRRKVPRFALPPAQRTEDCGARGRRPAEAGADGKVAVHVDAGAREAGPVDGRRDEGRVADALGRAAGGASAVRFVVPDRRRRVPRDGDVADETTLLTAVRRHVRPAATEVDAGGRTNGDRSAGRCGGSVHADHNLWRLEHTEQSGKHPA